MHFIATVLSSGSYMLSKFGFRQLHVVIVFCRHAPASHCYVVNLRQEWYMYFISDAPWCNLRNNVATQVQIMKFLIMQFCLQSLVHLSQVHFCTQHLFSDIFNLCCSLRTRNQVTHPLVNRSCYYFTSRHCKSSASCVVLFLRAKQHSTCQTVPSWTDTMVRLLYTGLLYIYMHSCSGKWNKMWQYGYIKWDAMLKLL
jgi:hypothetical protein